MHKSISYIFLSLALLGCSTRTAIRTDELGKNSKEDIIVTLTNGQQLRFLGGTYSLVEKGDSSNLRGQGMRLTNKHIAFEKLNISLTEVSRIEMENQSTEDRLLLIVGYTMIVTLVVLVIVFLTGGWHT
jgi:hypothetical protein